MRIGQNKQGQAGLTLIELALVIAVMLGLISVLFIGVAAYKKGSDRAECILQISSMQKAIRSYANMYEKNPGDTVATNLYMGPGRFLEAAPTCPDSGTYTISGIIPIVGVAVMECNVAGHVPSSVAGW